MALYEVSRPDRRLRGTLIGSTLLGLGISTMHYIGMAAMRLPAMHVYSPVLFTLSIALAVAISYVALQLAFASRQNLCHITWRKLGSAVVMGIAISSMHYVGMAAVSFVRTQLNLAGLSLQSTSVVSDLQAFVRRSLFSSLQSLLRLPLPGRQPYTPPGWRTIARISKPSSTA